MVNIKINKWESVDDLQYKGLKIIQDKRGFRFGIDAVLLANFAHIKKGTTVLDLGTGTGIIPILLAGKTEAKEIIGLEIQPQMVEMAKRSILLNKMQDRVNIIEGDIKEVSKVFKSRKIDTIITNPPYINNGSGLLNKEQAITISRHEVKCTLKDLINNSAKILKTGGKFNMVHRPERLADIIYLMRQYKIEPKKIRFIYSSYNTCSNLMLIEGIKDGKPQINILEPLYIYNEKGEYSSEINKIYNRQE